MRRDERRAADLGLVRKLVAGRGLTRRARSLPGLVAVLVAMSGTASGSIVPADAIRASLSSDIRSTNPGVNRDANTDTVMMHIVEGLVAYREDGTPGPLLADSIEVSPDGMTYTFRLRSGLRFHNGAPVTAADVVWTWRRYLAPDAGWECLPEFDGSRGNRIESVEAVAPDTIAFRLNRPQPMLLVHMAAIQCGGGGILHPSSVNPDGSWREPVATGPYRLRTWKRGQFIEVEAFPLYRSRMEPRDGNTGAKKAYASTIRWLIIRDSAARLAALAKGQIDVMPEVATAEMAQIRHLPDVEVTIKPMLVNYLLLIQNRSPLLDDDRIRKALAFSLDRVAIASLVTGGVGVANPSLVPSASHYHTSAHDTGRDFNVAEARRLLAQAGYKGQPLVLTTNRRYPAMFNQALLVQALARKAGINIELEVLEWATQLDRWKSGKYQLMSFGLSARADPYQNYESILGDRSVTRSKVWDDPAAIKMHQATAQTTDPAARQEIFDRMHALMLQDVPVIVLYSLSDVNAVRKDVRGFASWAFGRARFWGVQRVSEKR